MSPRTALSTLLLLALAGCAGAPVPPPSAPGTAEAAGSAGARDAFFANLAAHCGSAFAGSLTLEPPGDDMLTGTETLIVHFRECGADTLRVPFHIEREAEGTWDRSRTWLFIRHPEALELRHDHRHEDGTEDETTWYGGSTQTPGTPHRQEFVYAERRAQDGSVLGWRVEIVPNERYTYGTIRGDAWTWRVDFDLTAPVPPPPAPWGHEHRPPTPAPGS